MAGPMLGSPRPHWGMARARPVGIRPPPGGGWPIHEDDAPVPTSLPPPPLTFCVSCGRPIDSAATRCRGCAFRRGPRRAALWAGKALTRLCKP